MNRLIRIGVLKKIDNSQWSVNTFTVYKTNDEVRFISDFREVKNNKKKKNSIPEIQFLLRDTII